jgi:exodeoxyribonuclease-5
VKNDPTELEGSVGSQRKCGSVPSLAHRAERFNSLWSPQQDKALALVREWLRARDRPVFRLFGYAGTGKTELAREIGASVAGTSFAAFTGKAAHVMRLRGCAPCSTIHRLIYDARYDEQRRRYRYQLKSKAALADIKLIIVDECSMVNDVLAKDLLAFGIPVLPIGDPAQLPPVKGASYFMAAAPDIMLTEIHRQALENPILRLSNQIRAGGRLPPVGYQAGDALRISQDADAAAFDVVLVGRNDTRHVENRRLRVLHGFCRRSNAHATDPQVGETVVCLHNDYTVHEPVWNGSQWTIADLDYGSVRVSDDTELEIAALKLRDRWNGTSAVRVPLACFGTTEPPPVHGLGLQLFDYGYALTVHKAQGSEWPAVLLVNEARCFREHAARWLYTAITRASERLTILDYS